MNIYVLMALLISSVASLLAVHWIYFKVLKIAKVKNLVDNPDARKLQKKPVPVVGGIAVFFGVAFGLLAGTVMQFAFNQEVTDANIYFTSTRLIPVVLAMVIMLYTGTMDDIIGLTPLSRIVIETLVILCMIFSTGLCIDSLHGLWGIYEFSWWIGVPLTILTGVGIINAVNMVDGVNGLSSGLCITCSVLFGVAFLFKGDMVNAILSFCMASSLFLFFVHNVFGDKSRMFIGDAGTMVMGVLMTWFVIYIVTDDVTTYAVSSRICSPAMVLAFLSVPVFDTLRVMTMRIKNGLSPFSPDKTHLHHAFVALGISHSITALSMILINLAIVAIWVLIVCVGAPLQCQLYAVVLASVLLVWGTYVFLEHEKTSNSRKAQWLRSFSVKTHLGKTDWWKSFTRFLDAPEMDENGSRHLFERLKRKFMN